jgi:hypothetical protein
MGSKSVGEPPLLLSTSALTAFQAAVAAAKEDLRPGGRLASGAPASACSHAANGRPGAEADITGVQEEAVQQLCAPVSVKAVRTAVGELDLPAYLERFAAVPACHSEAHGCTL